MIEYFAPSGGGGSLTYPTRQVTLNLDAADFTKLNTAPITLIATDNTNYICPVNYFWEYLNVNTDPATFIYAGFEPLLGAFPNSGSLGVFGSNFQAQRGMLSYINLSYGGPNNSLHNEPLVLWSIADDPLLQFSTFRITIIYYLIPKFL